MKKLLMNLALLSLGALAFAAATLIPPMSAQAAADATPPITGVDWNFWIAVIGAAAGCASLLLHKFAPKSVITQDLDAMLSWWRTRATSETPPTLTIAPAPRDKQAGKVRYSLAALLAALGVAVAILACGGSQASRTATISSLDSGWVTAAAALRSYEHEHTQGIVDQAKAGTITPVAAAAQIAAFRAKVDKVWLAVDAAHAAIDAANTVNDDPSVAGAQAALNNAMTAIATITGGNAP